mgnify:CR=1 FL=1
MKATNKKFSEQFKLNSSDEFTAANSRQRFFEPRSMIKRQGDQTDSVFFLESGFLALSKTAANGRRQIINFLFPGEYCGITKRDYFMCDIECLSFTSLRIISKDNFENTLNNNSALMREIHDQQIYWNDGLEELIFLLGARSTEEKIASFLIFLNIRQYRYLQDPLYKEIPLSRADIGDFLGMRVETVSRTLSKFRKLKAIKSFDNNRIKILDYAALTKIAELEDSWKYWDQKHTHHS